MLAAGSYSGAAALLDSRTRELLCLLEGGHAGGLTHVSLISLSPLPVLAVLLVCVLLVLPVLVCWHVLCLTWPATALLWLVGSSSFTARG